VDLNKTRSILFWYWNSLRKHDVEGRHVKRL